MAAPDLVIEVTTPDLIPATTLLRHTTFTVYRSWLRAWDKVPPENKETLVSVMRHIQDDTTHPGIDVATDSSTESRLTINGVTLTFTRAVHGHVLWTGVNTSHS